jgi:DNA repair exonuclease SbcCD ATPase subunit
MYHSSNCALIDDKLEHARFVEEISKEKKKLKNKYHSLLAGVKKFTDGTEQKVIHHNYHKLKAKAQDEKEIKELKELRALKEKMKECEVETDALKEDKNKIEYMFFDLLKDGTANKNKLKTIKLIYDECFGYYM